METFRERIKGLRLERKLPLRTIAAELDIDQAILSKIERGQKRASRKHVLQLSAFFSLSQDELLVAWLSDKLVYELQNESVALKALQVAEEKVVYEQGKARNRASLIKDIKDFLKNDGRVSRAWMFGSFARGEEEAGSDVDLMVSYSDKASGTLMDYADLKYQMEILLKIKVDLVEEGFVQPFAVCNINRDKVLIYE